MIIDVLLIMGLLVMGMVVAGGILVGYGILQRGLLANRKLTTITTAEVAEIRHNAAKRSWQNEQEMNALLAGKQLPPGNADKGKEQAEEVIAEIHEGEHWTQ